MALSTHSRFYYGWQITTSNRYLDFNDGSDKVAILDVGYYTSSDLATMIASKMNELSSTDFTVTFNRSTRKFTIAGSATFSLLAGSGDNVTLGVFTLLGYTATDKTGFATYLAQTTSGYEYTTQFFPQSYLPTSTNRNAIEGLVNKSSSGVIEVIKFGDERFMKLELLFITNIPQSPDSIIRSKSDGVEQYIQLIEWLTSKAPVEVMINELDVDTFQEFILESTEQDTQGLNYELTELYDKSLPLFYKSGRLTFRLME